MNENSNRDFLALLPPEASQKCELARYFLNCYLSARDGLNKMGLLRTKKSPEGDYAEWLIAAFLDLQLERSAVAKGFDAVNKDGLRYQVKARTVMSLRQTTSFDFSDVNNPFDFLIGVFFSEDLRVLGIIQVARNDVLALGIKDKESKKFRFRWNQSIAKKPEVKKLFWTDEA